MSQAYAQGEHALGNCDRCGFQYLLHDLRPEVVNLNETGMKVCQECWDPDSPQYQLGRWPINDPQAVRNPRPDLGLVASRGFFGWDPLREIVVRTYVGEVIITSS